MNGTEVCNSQGCPGVPHGASIGCELGPPAFSPIQDPFPGHFTSEHLPLLYTPPQTRSAQAPTLAGVPPLTLLKRILRLEPTPFRKRVYFNCLSSNPIMDILTQLQTCLDQVCPSHSYSPPSLFPALTIYSLQPSSTPPSPTSPRTTHHNPSTRTPARLRTNNSPPRTTLPTPHHPNTKTLRTYSPTANGSSRVISS